MDLWCSVLKVHKFLGLHLRRYLGFKPDMFSGFMTSRFCASKSTDFFSWVCKPTLRTTVGLPQLWPTADLPFAQSIVSSIKFCNTCCRLRKTWKQKQNTKTGNTNWRAWRQRKPGDLFWIYKGKFGATQEQKMKQFDIQNGQTVKPRWNLFRKNQDNAETMNLKPKSYWVLRPRNPWMLKAKICEFDRQTYEAWCWTGLSTLRPKHV